MSWGLQIWKWKFFVKDLIFHLQVVYYNDLANFAKRVGGLEISEIGGQNYAA